MALGTEIYIDEIRVLGETIRDAIRDHDTVILRGIQAMESTIWNKVRASESIVSTIIANSMDMLDLSNPEKDKASKIKTHIMSEWMAKWRGVSAENIVETLGELERLELIDSYTKEYINRYGNAETVINEVSLRPVWDDIIEEIIREEGDSYIFASSIGKLIGLSIAGNRPDSRGRRAWGVASWRPVSYAVRSAGPDGKISKEEFKEIFIKTAHQGERKFYEMRERDKAKAREIRFIVSDDGAYVYINRDAILAYQRVVENARKLTAERGR